MTILLNHMHAIAVQGESLEDVRKTPLYPPRWLRAYDNNIIVSYNPQALLKSINEWLPYGAQAVYLNCLADNAKGWAVVVESKNAVDITRLESELIDVLNGGVGRAVCRLAGDMINGMRVYVVDVDFLVDDSQSWQD